MGATTEDLDKRLDNIFNALDSSGSEKNSSKNSSKNSKSSFSTRDPETRPSRLVVKSSNAFGLGGLDKNSSFADELLKRDGAGYSMDLPTLAPRAIRTGWNK